MKKAVSVLLIALLLPFFVSCTQKNADSRLKSLFFGDYFDTFSTLYYDGKEVTDPSFAEEFEKELRRLNGLFDAYHDAPFPTVKTVNDRAGASPVKVDADLLELLCECAAFSDASGGTVDPAIGAVSALWKEAAKYERLPDEAALKEASAHISPEVMQIDEEAGTVFLRDPAARIDVGASAKGYAARIMSRWLDERKIGNYLISLGGTLLARGKNPHTNEPWTAGVRDPFKKEDAAISSLTLAGAALATSGSYERCFTVNGKSYHHIIDPATCAPSARTDVVSVSVLHSDPAAADLLSTALFILPENEGNELLKTTGGEALRVYANGRITRTAGFPDDANKASGVSDFSVIAVVLLFFTAAFLILYFRRPTGRAQAREECGDNGKSAGKRRAPGGFRARDVILLSGLLAAAILLPFLLLPGKNAPARAVAVVRVEGKTVITLPLDNDTEYRVACGGGYNTVTVRNKKVMISDADCRGKDCVRTGEIDPSSTIPVIACLPHRLTVSIEYLSE